jgi:hypothetical protein
VLADTSAYTAVAAGKISDRLGRNGSLALTVEPGVELQGTGDVTLGDLDLSQWRFGPQNTSGVSVLPPVLTVRTTGSINLTGVISDGVVGSGTTLNLPQCDATACPYALSASVRLTAGADMGSADPTAVLRGAAGDLNFASSSIVRTGTGFISLSAARDVKFAAGASAYTTGTPGAPDLTVLKPATAPETFPTLGGQLDVYAGRDLIGTPIQQSVTAWTSRQVANNLTSWGIDAGKFQWSLGTLGGGDLHVTAGHDIADLSAAAADSAIEQSNGSALNYFGGGSLTIRAANDIRGGMYYVARSAATIAAGGSVALSPTWTATDDNSPLGAFIQLGNASVSVESRKDVFLEETLNPFLLSPAANGTLSAVPFFVTYGDNSALNVVSVSGDVSVNELVTGGTPARLTAFLGSRITARLGVAAGLLPGSISIHALSGDVLWAGAPAQSAMMPSPLGQLDIFAKQDFLGTLQRPAEDVPWTGGASYSLIMSDAPVSDVPSALAPSLGAPGLIADLFSSANSSVHSGDSSPILISAGRDIAGLDLELPKAAQISADRDITDLSVRGQNLVATDATLISAGRDFTYSNQNNNGFIEVGGPGRLDMVVGRQVDLGTSAGVTTTGSLRNPTIPVGGGADLTILAGVGAGMNIQQFLDSIVLKSDADKAQLVSFMESLLDKKGLTLDDATGAFEALDSTAQRPFVLDVFFKTLVQAGRDANTKPSTAYKAGYAAIDALFPGSRSANSNPYLGDISLAFSRIYTLDGGNISLVIPGGELNVGLAVPPLSVSQRPASQLGIVAEGTGDVRVFAEKDVLVNASRIFTLSGGDIAIWSTLGNIDAGKGAKSSVSAPPPTITFDAQGHIVINFTGAVSGSGIRTILTGPDVKPGNVDLIAPVGFVNAGDAGVGASGNLNIAAAHVLGVDNIQVGGTSTGVPPAVSGLGASLSGVSNVASSSSNSAANVGKEAAAAEQQSNAPIAQSALSWLDVFVEGFGEENCKPSDTECLNRNRKP